MTERKTITELINLDDNDEREIRYVCPYEQMKFEQWMRQELHFSEETIDKHIDRFIEGCEVADEELGICLYELLDAYISVIPQTTGTDITKELAVYLVEIYHDLIEELIADGRTDLSKAPRAFSLYKQFIEVLVDHTDKCITKKLEIPYKEEFLSWLEADLHKDYLNAKKDVSALHSVYIWISMLFGFEDYDLFNRLAEMSSKADRQRVIDLLREYKSNALPDNFKKMNIKKKTVENGLSCLQSYIHFLNDRDKK